MSGRWASRSRRRTVWLVFALAVVPAGAARGDDVRVREEGHYSVVHCTTQGEVLRRYTGFRWIADVTIYDATTFLVAECEGDRLTAIQLDGRVAWEVPLPRPRSVEVLGPDRLLVSLNQPGMAAEIDRAGTVLWKVEQPLLEPAGAVRLPDGNTAVVERRAAQALYVFNPTGEIVWQTGHELRQPSGLARLPTGELATSGFDTHLAVIAQPYTDRVRTLPFAGHGQGVTATADGGLLLVAPESQYIQFWEEALRPKWRLDFVYPPMHADMLPDGTLLVSVERQPDQCCMNAVRAAERRARPVAPYWRWFWGGLLAAAAIGVLLQAKALAAVFRACPQTGAAEPGEPAGGQSAEPPCPVPRRIELGAYVLALLGVTAAAVWAHYALGEAPKTWLPLLPYLGWVLVGGILLALLQARTPGGKGVWQWSLIRPAPASIPSWRMALLWGLGLACAAAAVVGVRRGVTGWPAGAWAAGLVLLVFGSLESPDRPWRVRPAAAAGWLLLFLALAALRLYRLGDLPLILHLDMASWSMQTIDLLQGEAPGLLGNGWAQIPLLGYLWSALFTYLAGISLAGCRLASVAASLLALAATAALVRRMYGTRAAVVAVVLLGVNHGFLHFSRIQAYMDPIPFHVLAILGLVAGFQSGKYGWFALAGLAGGYSALTYHAGRITPPTMILLALLLILRHPRTLPRRLPGLVLCALVGLAALAPQGVLYATGRSNPFGRADQFAWATQGHGELETLRNALREGVPRVFGSFWFYSDSSTQYGGNAGPIFRPEMAALLGVMVVAALLRAWDVRVLWLVVWTVLILFVGGVLTRDPPFWPRFVTAFVPACVLVAAALDAWCRGAGVAFGRAGRVAGTAVLAVFLGFVAWQHFTLYVGVCRGIKPGESQPTMRNDWPQGTLGRDIRRWGADAMVYLVALQPNEFSCRMPTLEFYSYEVDTCATREIEQYLPFEQPRTVACYFVPETYSQIDLVLEAHPGAEVAPFHDNLGNELFRRVVVPAGDTR